MAQTAVVYWSGTGNTETMAKAVAKGLGVEATSVDLFNPDDVQSLDAIALGCPSMGVEELESDSFQPFYDAIRDQLKGKRVALFGSYDWGDGEWMRTWSDDVKDAGATLVADGVIANLEPTDEDLAACEALGEALKG